ncbi:hypothetical protein BBJ28_00010216 [Nothophytophthora sp. Chile5]|nr:hypothetical protein BBJ28_00010216 [Nothophytophthora sp. Chile5]
MSNITDATCWYGLAQTAEGCVRTLASYDPEAYLHYQIIYCAVGVVTFVASAMMLTRAIKYEGSPLQRYNFTFCCYASATVIIRGVDPSSYGHVIPRPISSLLILALGYWAMIIQQGAAVVDRPTHLKCLEAAAVAFVWAFYIIYNTLLFMYKGFNVKGLSYMQLTVSAVMLGIISSVFLVYGLRVLSRLQEYERQKKMRMPSMLSERMMNHSFNMETLSDDEDGVPVVQEPKYVRRHRPQEGHAAKIRKILFVAESVSLIVIAGQMYMAVSRTLSTPVELSCANGMECDTVKSSLNLLHVLQVVCVWALLWTFRGVQKKEVVPQPQSAV